MQTIPAHVFKDSFGPFIQLLNEHGVKYQISQVRAEVPMAGPPGVVEIVQAVGAASAWAGLAAVVVAFIKARSGRKVIITTKDHTVIHAEGLTASELKDILDRAASISVVDTNAPSEKK
jgi:hypothetical protein